MRRLHPHSPRPRAIGCDRVGPREDSALRPTFPAWLALAALLLAVFLSAALGRNGGELSPPLDDAYIHFQYASQLANGHPYEYQAGAAPSSGATSLLWPLLLAAGVKLGFGGMALYGWALALALPFVAASAWHTQRWLGRVAGARTGTAGALALLLSGPWLWGAFSGMEIVLFSAALAGVLDLAVEPGERARRGALAWGCALALVRPEGAMLAGALVLVKAVAWRRGREEPARALLPWLLPAALGALQPLLNFLYTGVITSSSALAKRNPRIEGPSETVLADFVWDVVGSGFARYFVGPMGLVVLLLFFTGLVALCVRDHAAGRPGLGASAALFWSLPLLFLGLFLPLTWNHYRYVLPYLVVYVPVAALGASLADEAIARLRGSGTAATPFVLTALVVIWGTGVPSWADKYSKNTVDILTQHVDQARWVDEHLPANAVVAANDIGALAYLSGRTVLDLEGIVSMSVLPDALAGEGAVYSRVLRERPDALLVFPGWFPTAFQSRVFVPERHARLAERTVSGGDDLVLATLDLDRAQSGSTPPAGVGVVFDTLDVGDRADEIRHTFTHSDDPLLAARANTVVVGELHAGVDVVDSARRLDGPASFRLARPAIPTLLVARFGPSEGPAELQLFVDDTAVGTWSLPAVPSGAWVELSLPLPAGPETAAIRLVPTSVQHGPRGGWHLGRVWTAAVPSPEQPVGAMP